MSLRKIKKISLSEFNKLEHAIPANIYKGIQNFLYKKYTKEFTRISKIIEQKRFEMSQSNLFLSGIAPVNKYGIDKITKFVKSDKRMVSEIVKASKKPIWCRLLYSITSEFKPKYVLELGTCLGISTSYIAASLESTSLLYSLEGADDFSLFAESSMENLGLAKRVKFIRGLFEEKLPELLGNNIKFDLVFIDGHHDQYATINYYNMIKSRLSRNAILIFDDIRWSKGMLEAWKLILQDKDIPLFIDFGQVGICCFFESNDQQLLEVGFDKLKIINSK